MKKLKDFKQITDKNLDKLDMPQEPKLRLKDETRNLSRLNFKKYGFIGIPIVAAVIAFIVVFTGIFPQNAVLRVQAGDLMNGIIPQKVENIELSEGFLESTADFSIGLFSKSYAKGKNSLVSPISVYMALGMTANGAGGNTLKEFETLLGKKGLNITELNSYYSSLIGKLTKDQSARINIADSIWFRNDESLNVKKEFLQTNADYYRASVYKTNFAAKETIDDINEWVRFNTDNKIDKIIDSIDSDTIMYLINAISFDAQWETIYNKEAVRKGEFEITNGTKKTVDFMYSTESGYLKDDKAQGFIKPYKDGKYSFVALLPNEGVTIESYISSLTGKKFINNLRNKSEDTVSAALPIFKSDYSIKLMESLKQMGLKECFDSEKANFSKMESDARGNIYVSDVLHKTFISVDTQGTEAGAATKVEIAKRSMPEQKYSIILNRPFVYAIIDNETNLPLFIGTMVVPEV